MPVTKMRAVIGSTLFLIAAIVLLASSGVINVLSRNQVSHENVTGYRWEPSTAVGSTAWASSWTTYANVQGQVASYVTAWNGSSWNSPSQLTPPNNQPVGDLNLAWDVSRQRFVFATLDAVENVWYGYSTDSTGTNWVFGNPDGNGNPQPLFRAGDYPSIGVDSGGRIIVGNVNFICAPNTCLDTAVSTDGTHFTSTGRVFSLPNGGGDSRVIAAGSTFHAFTFTFDSMNRPTAVYRYDSTDGVNWGGANLLMGIPAPTPFQTPAGSNLPIYYAVTELSAAGYSDGRWIVGWQANINGWNNVQVYTSDRGAGSVNQGADDQFLAGVSASADGYWVTYHSYPNIGSRSLFGSDGSFGLITQAIYFPTNGSPVGATTNTGVNPTTWTVAGGQFTPARCTQTCYAEGDFNTPSSNGFAKSNMTFVGASGSRLTDLFNSFQQDPPGVANVPNFVPNFIRYQPGSDLSALAILNDVAGLAPIQKRGFMKK
jgi:hypothetical protein